MHNTATEESHAEINTHIKSSLQMFRNLRRTNSPHFSLPKRSASVLRFTNFHSDLPSFHSVTDNASLIHQSCTKNGVHARAIKRGYSTNHDVYIRLIFAYFRSGLDDHACKLLEDVSFSCFDLLNSNLMISKFMKIGQYDLAMKVFDEMSQRDVVSWNSVISGSVKNSRFEVAFMLFKEMMSDNIEPNEFTFASVMAACSRLGVISRAEWIHTLLIDKGIQLNPILNSALIDMYSKCGRIERAKNVFNSIQRDNVFIYNAMINGLALHGLAMEAVQLLPQMEFEHVSPDAITFVSLLKACGHDGLVKEGRKCFHLMTQKHSIPPQLEHYGAMIDLLARAGLIEQAYSLIKTMSMEPDSVIWRSILSSCKTYKKPELGQLAATMISQLESGDYVLLSNTYCSIQQWENAATLRKSMQFNRIHKLHGKSWIEISGSIHHFKSGDQTHPDKELIYKLLDRLLHRIKLEGFVFSTELVLMDVSDEEKEHNLSLHSEKLAVAFGILKTGPGVEISILKNLRTCYDCHSWIKLVAKVLNRVIIVRDRIRFHRFEGGLCSCRDYW